MEDVAVTTRPVGPPVGSVNVDSQCELLSVPLESERLKTGVMIPICPR